MSGCPPNELNYNYPDRKLKARTVEVQERWMFAYEHAKQIISSDALDDAVMEVVANIRASCDGKRAFVSWSGGKDSIVLYHIASFHCGIVDGLQVSYHEDFEYPSLERWMSVHRPPDIVVRRTHLDFKWLQENKSMLFSYLENDEIMMRHKWALQRKHFHDGKYDIMLSGRRNKDNNFCGKGGWSISKDGFTTMNPLYLWDHEHILAYLRWNDLVLPPLYFQPNGFYLGAQTWISRNHGSEEDTWRVLLREEPEIVNRAAPYFPLAEKVWGENHGI